MTLQDPFEYAVGSDDMWCNGLTVKLDGHNHKLMANRAFKVIMLFFLLEVKLHAIIHFLHQTHN